MHARFPTISALCREHNLNLATDLIPVAPAAHYCMGGVRVDTYGRTTVPGLYAVGEVACTGVHGANRLASNSLLEGLVYGVRIADFLADKERSEYLKGNSSQAIITNSFAQEHIRTSAIGDEHTAQAIRVKLQQIMWQYVSLVRDETGLLEALGDVRELRLNMVRAESARSQQRLETLNMLLVAELVIIAALARHESRGSHWRLDYQATDEALAKQHFVLRRDALFAQQTTDTPQEVAIHV